MLLFVTFELLFIICESGEGTINGVIDVLDKISMGPAKKDAEFLSSLDLTKFCAEMKDSGSYDIKILVGTAILVVGHVIMLTFLSSEAAHVSEEIKDDQ